jgi:hypothetical protein
MKNALRIALLSVMILPIAGCTDFFDITDPKTLSTDNFPATLDQVDLEIGRAHV